MHKLLARQLRRFFGSAEAVPEPLLPLLGAVDEAYRQADADRDLLERTMDTVSDELLEGRGRLQVALEESRSNAAELSQALSLLTATLESTADGILVLDLAGRVVLANGRFAEMWRVPRELQEADDAGRMLEHLCAQLEEPDTLMARVLAAGADAEADGVDVLQFRDGRAFEGFSRPRRVDGRTVGRVWSFHDITERRALEEQLRQSQKMEAVGRLAGGVAHDFNNVLTVLKFHADFLKEAALPPELAENVAEIGVAASHAADLTRQLLAFSRKQVLRPVVLEVDAVVANLQPMLRRLLGEDVRLVARRAPVGAVLADRGQLEQVLVNLVVNSRDAMPDGGTITVRTGPVTIDARDPHARARTLAPGTYLALSVTDTGQGIPPEVLDRVFEPFFTTKELGKGSGLGLSTVYGIVRQSGGAVDVVSELGRGTVVRVLLPLAPAAARPDPADAPRKPGMGTETVLLVEDETTLRRLGRKVLERSGYTVLEACDGGDAVEVAARFAGRIDLLVTDVVMPTMHGRQVAECLRKARGELRVLFMSGYTDDEVLRRGALGAGTAFLQKPFTPAEFADAVRDVLDSPLPSLPGASGGAALPETHAAAGH